MSLIVILRGPFLSGSIGASVCRALALAEAGDVDATRARCSTRSTPRPCTSTSRTGLPARARGAWPATQPMPPTRSNAPSV